MKRPTFSAVSAARTSNDMDNTDIVLTDGSGNTLPLKLSAQAHTQLITSLLSTPRVRQQGGLNTFRPVQALGAQGFQTQSGLLGLQFFVGQAAGIDIVFPPKALHQLKDTLEKLENPGKPPSAN